MLMSIRGTQQSSKMMIPPTVKLGTCADSYSADAAQTLSPANNSVCISQITLNPCFSQITLFVGFDY